MQILKDDIRKRILDAAIRQFARKSYAKTSMREIAREAGITNCSGKLSVRSCAPWKPCWKSITAYGAKIL